ncbi:MAG: peptide-binding protein [Planctomycetota bacterium]|jgi:peptide/nickel transport system substrate-binding protein
MNGRSGWATFVLFILLAVMILLQILSMIQSDRLYERLNAILERATSAPATGIPTAKEGSKRADLPMEQYPGDEGDWLVWCIDAEPATLNPITAKDVYQSWISGGEYSNVFQALLEYDLDKVTLKPQLAESYQVSDDGMEITFRLRDDIHFSDGVPITTDDVIFTYETIMNPGVDAARLAHYYRDIDRVVKVSDREVKFLMKRLYFKSLEFTGGMPIMPKHIYTFSDPAKFNERRSNPVGSGPYVFEKWDVGSQIVIRRNENYWGQKPKIEKIVFRVITNQIAAIQSLRAGEIDFMRLSSEEYVDLCSDEEFNKTTSCISYWSPTRGYGYIGWNQKKPFFSDRRVRLALTHIIDREAINKHLAKGLAKVVSGPFYIYGPQSNPNINPWPYDVEKAKALLDEAGWVDTDGDGIRDKDGVKFKFKFMITTGGGLPEKVAKLLKEEAAKVGIEVIVDPYEWSVFQEKITNRNFDAVHLAWGGVIESDPYQIWHSSQIQGRGSNYVGFNVAEADALIEKARQTMDAEPRNKLYHKFHEILHKEQPYTFVLTSSWKHALDKRFENVNIHKIGLNPHEWYVPLSKQKY